MTGNFTHRDRITQRRIAESELFALLDEQVC